MDAEALRRYENNGDLKHLVFAVGRDEIRTRNGTVVAVTAESLVFRTVRDEELCIRLCDVLRLEDYRQKPADNSWREVYESHGVDIDYETERRKGGDSDG